MPSNSAEMHETHTAVPSNAMWMTTYQNGRHVDAIGTAAGEERRAAADHPGNQHHLEQRLRFVDRSPILPYTAI